MIGYYVHHHGLGHLNRALSICAHLSQPVVALTAMDIPGPHRFAGVLRLPRDDTSARPTQPSAHGALHWVPHHDDGLRARMALIAQWVEKIRPRAVVVDVSVEVALFVRLLGVPTIVMAMPGQRTDGPHTLVHQLADHIVAAWPQDLYEPDWLRAHSVKTSYVGGISRFEDRNIEPSRQGRTSVLVLGGKGGCAFDQATVDATAEHVPEIVWQTLGLRDGPSTVDPWPHICAADVVITHAGQSCVADVAAARRPAIVIPQPRPFDEQYITAETLRNNRLALTPHGWPEARAWRSLTRKARSLDSSGWKRWHTEGAAARAAHAIETTASRYAQGGQR